jgi:hypothetical protein
VKENDMTDAQKTIAEQAREWDEGVEDRGAPDEDARRPFDAGLVLAAATMLEAWEDRGLDKIEQAVRGIEETLVEIIGNDEDVAMTEADALRLGTKIE